MIVCSHSFEFAKRLSLERLPKPFTRTIGNMTVWVCAPVELKALRVFILFLEHYCAQWYGCFCPLFERHISFTVGRFVYFITTIPKNLYVKNEHFYFIWLQIQKIMYTHAAKCFAGSYKRTNYQPKKAKCECPRSSLWCYTNNTPPKMNGRGALVSWYKMNSIVANKLRNVISPKKFKQETHCIISMVYILLFYEEFLKGTHLCQL